MSAVIHRCADCGHKDGDHGHAWGDGVPTKAGGWCSMGGCFCRKTPVMVQRENPAETVPTWRQGENPFTAARAS